MDIISGHDARDEHGPDTPELAHSQFRPEFRLIDIAELVLNLDPVPDAITFNQKIKIVACLRLRHPLHFAHLLVQNVKAGSSKGGLNKQFAMMPHGPRKHRR